jgi:hypothetical protein
MPAIRWYHKEIQINHTRNFIVGMPKTILICSKPSCDFIEIVNISNKNGINKKTNIPDNRCKKEIIAVKG